MKIAFVHYHLKTGGVTTVIRQQVAALRGICDCLLITGERGTAEWPCRVIEIQELGYDRPGVERPSSDRIAERVIRALTEFWPRGCDVMHIHNPTLAKNRQFLQIIKRLQAFGVNLFLQIHDFAEDGRPGVYFEDDYPADCHYAVINTRDRELLKKAGLHDAGLHYLPNAVEALELATGCRPKRQILYPVRAIRRKNIGEAIILSLLLESGQCVAVTQPPNSPVDLSAYRDWLRWREANRVPVDFGAGQNKGFDRLVAESASMLTTSIAEGFGFAFLEPWTAGKGLWGRRLDGICDDFTTQGIQLSALYGRIDIPLAWFDAKAFRHSWYTAVAEAAACYGNPVESRDAEIAYGCLTRHGKVDLGLLSERFQRQVASRLMKTRSDRELLMELNPSLKAFGAHPASPAVIAANREAIVERYGRPQARRRLLTVYEGIVRHFVRHRIDKAVLQRSFFDLDRFSLLKWGAYEA